MHLWYESRGSSHLSAVKGFLRKKPINVTVNVDDRLHVQKLSSKIQNVIRLDAAFGTVANEEAGGRVISEYLISIELLCASTGFFGLLFVHCYFFFVTASTNTKLQSCHYFIVFKVHRYSSEILL